MRCPGLRLVVVALAVVGCARPEPPAATSDTRPAARPYLNVPTDEHGPIPALLSGTGAFDDTRSLTPNSALIPYDLNVPF